MIILALDLATNTGFAFGKPDASPEFGSNVLPSTGDDVGRFLLAHEEFMHNLIDQAQPDLLLFESPVFYPKTGADGKLVVTQSKASLRKLYGLAGITEMVALKRKVDCGEVDNQKAKKVFTGAGGKKGDRIIGECHSRGWLVNNEDEADACCVWFYGVVTLDEHNGTSFAKEFDPLFAAGRS